MSLGLSYITAILAVIFAASLADQYVARRQPYHLVWTATLMLISAAMVLWFVRELLGLSDWIYRLWYLSGPMLVPAYLGTGVLYMTAPRTIAHRFMAVLLVITVVATASALMTGIRTPENCIAGFSGLECLSSSDTLTRSGFLPSWLRILTAVLNLYGGFALLAGLGMEPRPRCQCRGGRPTGRNCGRWPKPRHEHPRPDPPRSQVAGLEGRVQTSMAPQDPLAA